ncbi:hypothetical protein Tco_0960969, partial [Tanacetum coccineum]
LAKVLDAEVKTWNSGKQGHLRALLSSLQFLEDLKQRTEELGHRVDELCQRDELQLML